jgi:hypothetical protein
MVSTQWLHAQGGGEKRKLSLRKLRKPGGRKRKYFAPCFEISHTKRDKTLL